MQSEDRDKHKHINTRTNTPSAHLYMCQLTKTKEREHPSRAWIIKERQKSLVFFPPVSPSFVCLVNPSVVYSEFSTNKMEDRSLHGAHTTHVSNLTLYKYLSLTWRGLWWRQNCWNSVYFRICHQVFPLLHCSWRQTQTMPLQWHRTETRFCFAGTR